MIPSATYILPVITIDPDTSIDPVNSNVSMLLENTKLPVSSPLKLIDPVKTSDPDIATVWFRAETNDAVLASDAVCENEADVANDALVAWAENEADSAWDANDALIDCKTYDAVVAVLASDAVCENDADTAYEADVAIEADCASVIYDAVSANEAVIEKLLVMS